MAELISPVLFDLFKLGSKLNFSAGEVILNAENPDGVYLIESGFVKVYSISDQGDINLHIIYQAGEIFPLVWAIRGVRRNVYYEAISDVIVSKITKNKITLAIQTNAKLAFQLLMQLSGQFMVFVDRVDNVQSKKASERTVKRLLFLANRFGQTKNNKIVITAPITHELIAQSIGLTRETVSREIEKLEKSKIISRADKHIIIQDFNRLVEESGDSTPLDLRSLN